MSGDLKVELKRGLRDVYIDRTESSFIDGKAGKLLYRGYNIHDLAENSTFEETSYLLLHGNLPTSPQLAEFTATLKSHRILPEYILEIIRLTKDAHPMDVLRNALSAMSVSALGELDRSPESTLREGIRLTAAAPTILATHDRIRKGEKPVPPNGDLNHAGNLLYMLFNKLPDTKDTNLIDKDFVLHAEHGVNASSFAARVAASTQADYYAAITAAVAVLKGPLHGGAAEGVFRMAMDIGTEENAKIYVENLLASKGRVMGFGHPVYRAVDPRSVHLKEDAQALGERKGKPQWFSILQAVTETKAMQQRARRGLRPNVDFWSGIIYHLLDISEDMFIPIFALGRIPGWTLHIMEQYANNILLRPSLEYVGPLDLEYIPIDQRK